MSITILGKDAINRVLAGLAGDGLHHDVPIFNRLTEEEKQHIIKKDWIDEHTLSTSHVCICTNFDSHLQALGYLLERANQDCFNYRYDDDGYEFEFVYQRETCDPVQTLKTIQCLRYNSEDVPNFENTFASEILHAATARTVRQLAGYDAARWF